MAKQKIVDLAKELNITSEELLQFTQANGGEAKTTRGSVEEDLIDKVKAHFGGKSAAKKEAPAEAKPVKKEKAEMPQAEAPKAPAKEEKAEAQKSEQSPKKPAAPEAGDAPRKKKKIFIVTGNNKPNNGYRQQGQGQGTDRRPGQGGGQNPYNRPLVRPTQRPSSPMGERQLIKPSSNPQDRASKFNRKVETPQEVAPKTEETRTNSAPVTSGERPQSAPSANRSFAGRRDDRRPQGGYQGTPRPQGQGGFAGRGGQGGDRRPGQGTGSFQGRPGQGGRPFNGSGAPGQGRPGQGGFNKGRGGNFTEAPAAQGGDKHGDEKRRSFQADRDRKSKKDLIYEEDGQSKKPKAGRFIRPEKKVEAVEEQIKVITLPETLTIKELADKMKMQPSVIIKKLFLQGQIVTVNSDITYEEAENIAIDYDIICEKEVKVDVIEELLKEDEEDESTMVKRPPVVCVMGHVDHGKTSLLDAIRKTNVTDREAGGITQAIGAYTVRVNDQKITFLDTPGHEAFTAMRMRGANATDIAILVVAADDGVMPQTVEAINHARAAETEIIVAITKIDKPNANPEKVKNELMEYNLVPVQWGGSTEFVPISSKTGEGIESLLETVLLTADILDLKANKKRAARGLVIEAKLDKGRGPVATVLVQKGTLHVGDFISAGACSGKVRAMLDENGKKLKEAGPSTPAEILGLSDVPDAGEVFLAHDTDKEAKSYAQTYLAEHKEKMLAETKQRMSLDDLFSQIQAGNLKQLDLIVKADVQGSVEALKASFEKLSNEEVVVKCIHTGVGTINESDVSLASASNAIVIGFNVKADAQAKALADREEVEVKLYKVIYQAIEDVEYAMKGMLAPVYEEKVIGHAEVRQIFKASAIGNIAGSYVLDGVFERGCKVRITREGEQIFEGDLKSLKRFKDDVKEVKAGFECGLVFDGFDQMQELDTIEAYKMVEVPRT
ncbi:MAG: translation initiation factor IF-2 [Lachnospiraceae bacterium]|nr:translation initiation factor IF-2 [Lachnospiraceae bacterium]